MSVVGWNGVIGRPESPESVLLFFAPLYVIASDPLASHFPRLSITDVLPFCNQMPIWIMHDRKLGAHRSVE
jgi:hypothetical protein